MSENSMTLEKVADTTEMEGKYLTFLIDAQLFGMAIADVVQIISVCPITEVPEYPYYAKGIINLRGGVVPVIDVRARLGKPECAYDDKTCIIVTSVHSEMIGFIVDQVDAVSSLDDEQISKLPDISSMHDESSYLIGVGMQEEKTVLLLDCRKLVPEGFEGGHINM